MLPCFLQVLCYGAFAPRKHQSLCSRGLEALYNGQKYVIIQVLNA